MAMQIEQKFVIRAPPDKVWAFLTDPYRVAGCLPGASITEKIDDRTYAGTITIKVGPVSASYKGKLHFERLDVAARSSEIVASGQDVRGRGGADMRMTSRLVEHAPGETEATVISQVNVIGILAQFGRGMIQDVSDQMFEKFTSAMRAELETGADPAQERPAAPSESEPIEVVSLGTKIIGRALSRTVRRPYFWAVVVLAILVIYWLWLR